MADGGVSPGVRSPSQRLVKKVKKLIVVKTK